MWSIIQRRKYWYALSGTLIALSVLALSVWRLNLGIDFTGGSLLQLSFPKARPEAQAVIEALRELDLGEITAQNAGPNDLNLRLREIDEATHLRILEALQAKFTQVEEKRFETIGSLVGRELKTRSIYAIILVLLFVLLYIAWSFRRVSRPVSSWRYGLAAIIALFHDVLVTVGVFATLGHFLRIEVGAPFIAALLTVLAYSVNDTIVVFDRTRENLFKMSGTSFTDIVNVSVNQTMLRSVNTSATILLSLCAIFFFGGESIRYFALTLIIGIAIGTYSSIFLASPLLVSWQARAGAKS